MLTEEKNNTKDIYQNAPTAEFPLTDSGNAEAFAAMYGDALRYDHPQMQWFIFKNHCLRLCLTGDFLRCAA